MQAWKWSAHNLVIVGIGFSVSQKNTFSVIKAHHELGGDPGHKSDQDRDTSYYQPCPQRRRGNIYSTVKSPAENY